jgi:hypothetical protein
MTVIAAPATLDILDPAFRVNSAAVREAAAAHWYAQTALGPAILAYDDCAALLHDRRARQASASHLADQGITDHAVETWWRTLILSIDGPDHARLRRLVAPAFTSASVNRLRARMREIVNELVDAFAADGRCEFVDAFADHYPPRVIFDLLGIPAEEHARMLGWGKELTYLISYEMPAHLNAVAAAIEGVCGVTDRLIAERRRDPGDDLISALVGAGEGGDRLTRDEICSMVIVLVVGGQDSTRCSLGHALTTFAAHPEQWALLGQRPELAVAATEEVLRVNPVCPIVWRLADVEFDHRDLRLTAGTRIWLLVGHGQLLDAAGNPDPFDITREHRPQLNFGHGPHFCLGAQLARAELTEALAVLARRLPDLALDGEAVYRPELAGFVGAERLPIRFTPFAI